MLFVLRFVWGGRWQRQIMKSDENPVPPRQKIHKRAGIAFGEAEIMENALPPVKKHLHVENFHRQA